MSMDKFYSDLIQQAILDLKLEVTKENIVTLANFAKEVLSNTQNRLCSNEQMAAQYLNDKYEKLSPFERLFTGRP